MEFNWRYALDKLLIGLTSVKTLSVVAGALFAIFGFELTPLVQAYVAAGAGIAVAVLKLLDSILDGTEPPM